MIKLEREDFIFEVKEELSCYEDIGQKGASEWEKGFNAKFPDIKAVSIDDESEIFEIADEYLEALETGSTAAYWKSFKI